MGKLNIDAADQKLDQLLENRNTLTCVKQLGEGGL